MGSPLSPIVANIFMEHFEEIAMKTANKTPSMWLRYVDTFSLWPHGPEELSLFLEHINSIRPSIQFIMEIEEDRKIPFLDVLVVKDSGRIRTEVYRKPTHTDRYLHYQSYHPQHIKTGIIRTLIRRSEQICNTAEAADHERRHLIQVFQSNGYPTAFIQRAMNPKRTSTKDKQAAPLATISIPYIKGTSERIRRCLSRVDIQVTFRSRATMRSLLMRVRPRRSPLEYKGVIYKIPCHDCDQVYIGETGRHLITRLKEHQRHCKYGDTDKSAVALHTWTNNHCIDWDSSSVIDREDRLFQRRVKEALHIRRMSNFNQGLTISSIWNGLEL